MMPEEQALSPSHRAHLDAKAARIDTLRGEIAHFFPHPAAVVLEIGCGHGHYLTAYAQQHPQARCLGVDLVTKRIEKANQKRDKRGVTNLLFLKAEINECLAAWPEHLALERVFVLFPDPWPKKRHIKNRILQPALLDQLACLAKPGTPLHFRTDHRANFDWVTEVIANHPLWQIRADAGWPFENPSYFQDLFTEHHSLTAVRADA